MTTKFRPVPLPEAAAIAGLAVSTLRTYCASPGRSSLVRDQDFYVHRRGMRRQTYFTARGMARLIARAYSTEPDLSFPSRQADIQRFNNCLKDKDNYGLSPRYHGTSRQEARQRVGQRLYSFVRAYLAGRQACAVPACPCISHRCGVPQADDPEYLLATGKIDRC